MKSFQVNIVNKGHGVTRALAHSFHLPGNFLAKGNFELWQEKKKEIHFGRKLEGNLTKCQENARKSYRFRKFWYITPFFCFTS